MIPYGVWRESGAHNQVQPNDDSYQNLKTNGRWMVHTSQARPKMTGDA